MNKKVLFNLIRKKKSKRVASAVIAAALFFGVLPVPEIGDILSDYSLSTTMVAVADDITDNDPDFPHNNSNEIRVPIHKLAQYSRNAARYQQYHQNDIISIFVEQGTDANINMENFSPLGTQMYPFNGQVRFEATASNLVLNMDGPLFNYVYDSVKLNNNNSSSPLRISRTTLSSSPVIANNVIHNDSSSTVTNWYIKLMKPSTGGTLQGFGGFIGRMWNGYTGAVTPPSPASTGSAKLKVYADMTKGDDSGDISISGGSDLGLLCGSMDAETELEFELNTDRKILNIETSNGDVGGLVGSLGNGAKLTYKGSNNQKVNQKISTSGGYAGGIIGKNNGGTFTLASGSSYAPLQYEIVGTDGTGSVFGYYKTSGTDDITVDVSAYNTINCTLKGEGNNGGLFGVLESTNNVVINVDADVTSDHSTGAARTYGGLIGKYKTDSMAHTLTINGTSNKKVSTANAGKSTYYGGGIGEIDPGSTSYVKFNGFTLNQAANAGDLTFGGLVASADNAFIESVASTIKVNDTFKGGALVGSLEHGVLKMSGKTDLSGAKAAAPEAAEAKKVGQLVGFRDDALIYGTSDWDLHRSAAVDVDDIGAWGEVVRLSSSALSGLLTESSGHIITIAEPSTTIASTLDFAKAALCFQINAEKNPYVQFAGSGSLTWETIKSSNIVISSDIDLSDTGFNGLTRDNNVGAEDKVSFSGTITSSGGKKIITLAIGESFGKRSDTPIEANTAKADGTGAVNNSVYRHSYIGLVGVLDGSSSTASISNLIFTGRVDIKAKAEMYVGAAAASAKGNISLTGLELYKTVTSGETTAYVPVIFTHAGSSALSLGGLLGEATDDIRNITVSNCKAKCDISGTASGDALYLGGVIGRINDTTNSSNSWGFSNIDIDGTITNTWGIADNRMGGLIAAISPCDVGTNETARELTLNSVTVDGLTLSASSCDTETDLSKKRQTQSLGGLLGYSWDNVRADFNLVEVKNSTLSLSEIKSGYGDMAGLVYEGTGYWTVNTTNVSGTDTSDIKIDNITVSASGGQSFGMFVNKAWHGYKTDDGSSALYLEIQDTDAYKITNCDSLPAFTTFDEYAAYSAYYRQDNAARYGYPNGDEENLYVLQNGSAIISIKTDVTKGLNMDNGTTASHSFTPQTNRGSSMNPYTRYYYNIDTVKDDTSASGMLMRWGLRQYAHGSIKYYFPKPSGFDDNSIPSGTYDMSGYSWYPVDIDITTTVNGTFKFYNKQFEGSEAKADGNHTTRSSLQTSTTTNQHFLMQNGLFRNVNSSSTLTIGTVTLQGNVGKTAHGSGALICGRVQGAQDHKAKVDVTGNIVLEQVYVHDISTSSTEYAPLAINKVGDHTELNISAKQSTKAARVNGVTVKYNYMSMNNSTFAGLAMSGTYPKAGTSLIGKVGLSDKPIGITLNFNKIILDGRDSAVIKNQDNSTNTVANIRLNSVYGSDRTIFINATLLESFKYDSGSFGKYDFTWSDDWEEEYVESVDTFVIPRQVTYGKELGYTKPYYEETVVTEYPDQELWYSGEPVAPSTTKRYTNPSDNNDTTGWYSSNFVNDFLPYVAQGYDKNNKYHQIQVNHGSASFSGCGTYNDPYIVTSSEQLGTISKILRGNDPSVGFKVFIPKKDKSTYDISATWHIDKDNKNNEVGHASYEYKAAQNEVTSTDPETGETTVVTPYYPAGYYLNGTYANVSYDSSGNPKDSNSYLTPKTIQTYLAGAYYKVGAVEKIEITSTDFKGLGYSGQNMSTNKHAVFRGVFIGDNKEIINKTEYPFIASSNGCVVKDLTLTVKYTDNITITGSQSAFAAVEKRTYGGLIGEVLGGDNIIDNVLVDYSGYNKKITASGQYAQLAPIGGYIGVVVNGGVIFRNMTTRASSYHGEKGLTKNKVGASGNYPSGLSTSDMLTSSGDNKPWLYVNPIIGRVINGFAVTESDDYRPFEDGTRDYGDGKREYWTSSDSEVSSTTKAERDANSSVDTQLRATAKGVTLRNGTKNYSITDVKSYKVLETEAAAYATANPGKTLVNKIDNTSATDIKLQNAQALFLLSVIVNSGMKATVDNTGYYHDYQISRWADYSGVTTDTTATKPTTGDYSVAESDNKSRAGYIAGKYTTNQGNKNMSGSITLTDEGKTYYLPDGFKGIGNMYTNNANLRFDLTNLNGGGVTISQNSRFYHYYTKDSNASTNKAFDTGYQLMENVGFGLFNYQGSATSSTSKRYYNFKLTGNVIGDCIDNTSGDHIPYLGNNSDWKENTAQAQDKSDGIDRKTMLSVGGLIGSTNQSQYVDSVAVDNIYVKGVRNAGGVIGWMNNSAGTNTYYRNTLGKESKEIKVHSGGSAGGVIGKSYQGNIEIDNNNAPYSITEVVSDCDNRSGYDANYGVGGFIGYARTDKNSNRYVKIQKVKVGDKDSKATTVKCNDECINGIMTGGLVGILNNAPFTIDNCQIYNQSVTSPYTVGGLAGYVTCAQKDSTISNVEVFAKSGSNALIECTGLHSSTSDGKISHVAAGGFVGVFKSDLKANVKIKDSSITGYNITAKEIAGGIIGIIGQRPTSGSTNSPYVINVNNVKASDCIITASNTASGSLSYAGGILGAHYCPSDMKSIRQFNGYNILAKNLNITATNRGYICGWRNDDTYCLIKLSGFSRQDDRSGGQNKMFADLVGAYPTKSASNTSPTSSNLYGTNGYVVFADYNDRASSASSTTQFANVTTSGTNVTVGSPFVTAVPQQYIDNAQYLTGDAMGEIDLPDTVYSKILADTTAKTLKSYTMYPTLTASDTNNVSTHFSSSHDEFISLPSGVKDFPLLVIEDTVDENITNLINTYIRVLTNTDSSFNYAQDKTNVYTVDISKWEYSTSESKFKKSSGSANLSIESNKFHIDGQHYDTSETPTFTLVDVQFLDPSSSNVAYHLYVPVYVKKLLQYNFYASLASNTEYFKNGSGYQLQTIENKKYFDDNKLFENLGNPITLGFEYVYARTSTEWALALNSGENVYADSNFRKSIIIGFLNSAAWSEDMKLVLVDSSKNGKNYYLDYSELPTVTSSTSEVELDLIKFKSVDDPAQSWEPATFNSLMTAVVIEQDTNGTLIRTTAPTVNTTFEWNGYYYEPKGNNTSGPFFTVKSVQMDSERYFLSFFTKKQPKPGETGYDKDKYEKIYYYSIKTKNEFDRTDGSQDGNQEISSELWHPNKIINNSYPYLLLGNLYENTFDLKVNSHEDKQLMTSSNNFLKIRLTSTIALTDVATDPNNEIYRAFELQENETANISQAFLMTYSMLSEAGGDEQVGIVRQAGSIENEQYYLLAGTVNDPDDVESSSGKISILDDSQFKETANYVEVLNGQNLISYLANSTNNFAVTLQASFEYLYSETGLANQFPSKDETDSESGIGTKVIGYSNISSSEKSAAYSATSEKIDNLIRYYTQGTSSSGVLTYNMVEQTSVDTTGMTPQEAEAAEEAFEKSKADGKNRSLGINAKTDDSGHIISRADYDTHMLSSQGDYIELTLTVSKKSSYVNAAIGNPVESGTALPISDYLSGLKITTGSTLIYDQDAIIDSSFVAPTGVTVTDGGNKYTVRVRTDLVEKLAEDSTGRYVFKLEYDVKTGDGEGDDKWNKEYSNYKVSLTAAMYSTAEISSADYQKNSYAYDHLIYTNAKIEPNVIEG